MSSVLVLNASWEPLSRTRLSRAVAMVTSGVAELHEAVEGRVLRSEKGFMPWPRIVRLVRYLTIKRSHAPAPWSGRGVMLRDSSMCIYCGAMASTVEHLVPRSRGGGNTWDNTAACCKRCNNKKGSKTMTELGWALRWKPWHPTRTQLASLEFGLSWAHPSA